MDDSSPYDLGLSPWRPDSAPDTSELDEFREALAQRQDKGAGLWRYIHDMLVEQDDGPPVVVPSVPGTPLRSIDPGEPVVYYVVFADRVKIGTTTQLRTRLTGVPHDEVLATEAGGYHLEAQRHRQFADLRIHGEWFRYEDPLISHIEAIRTG